ncbi:MAG: hypothetical protein IKG39_01755 [Lachnospiraceae bacterium]|nr:hypothetical protein [Lachnospiraceae bacterium]
MENNEIKDERTEELKVQGACHFCGQTYMINGKIGGMTEEERDEIATEKCSCSEAKSYVRKKQRRKKIDAFVNEVYSKSLQEKIKAIIAAVEEYEIDKVTLTTSDGWTTKIYMDKDSYLNIKRKKTDVGRELKA